MLLIYLLHIYINEKPCYLYVQNYFYTQYCTNIIKYVQYICVCLMYYINSV